jgi:hypothetical protein
MISRCPARPKVADSFVTIFATHVITSEDNISED